MQMRKLSLILILIANNAFAGDSCKVDCQNALNAADKVIANLKEEISVRKQLVQKQDQAIADLSVSLNDKNQELSSWLHNPFIMVTVGVLVGGIATAYVVHLTK